MNFFEIWCKVRLRHLATKLNTHERCAQQHAVCETLTTQTEISAFCAPATDPLLSVPFCHSQFCEYCNYARAGIRSLFSTAAIHPRCVCRLPLKCDGTRAETSFRLSAKRTSPFRPAGASVQSTTGRRAVHISLQCLYCSCKPVFCSHVTFTGYPLNSLVSSSLLLPCFTVCHHISAGLYFVTIRPHTTPRYSQYSDTFRLIQCHRETLYLRVVSVDCVVICVCYYNYEVPA
jgi:hypothetical protein